MTFNQNGYEYRTQVIEGSFSATVKNQEQYLVQKPFVELNNWTDLVKHSKNALLYYEFAGVINTNLRVGRSLREDIRQQYDNIEGCRTFWAITEYNGVTMFSKNVAMFIQELDNILYEKNIKLESTSSLEEVLNTIYTFDGGPEIIIEAAAATWESKLYQEFNINPFYFEFKKYEQNRASYYSIEGIHLKELDELSAT